MTPRQSDVAFVLEGVPGVLDVFALARPDVGLEFAVKLEHGTAKLAAAHYALLRVLSREECRGVVFFETQLPPGLERAATRIEPSAVEREASRARVRERGLAFEEPPLPGRVRSNAPFAALLVGCHSDVYRAVVDALGIAARRAIESDPRAGAETALKEKFDVILCSARSAFGAHGFLTTLQRSDTLLASRVIVVAAPGERELALANLEEIGRYNTCLPTPLDPAMVLEIARTGFVMLPWSIPVPRVRQQTTTTALPASEVRTVLVIDDDIGTQMLPAAQVSPSVKIVVTDDPWTALDHLEGTPPALVLCSASLRAGTTPFYRLLWTAHPELKARFMLIASRDDLPASATRDHERMVMQRPITADRIAEALRRLDSRSGDV